MCYIFIEIEILSADWPVWPAGSVGRGGAGRTNLFDPCKNAGQTDLIHCQCKLMQASLARNGLIRLTIPICDHLHPCFPLLLTGFQRTHYYDFHPLYLRWNYSLHEYVQLKIERKCDYVREIVTDQKRRAFDSRQQFNDFFLLAFLYGNYRQTENKIRINLLQ